MTDPIDLAYERIHARLSELLDKPLSEHVLTECRAICAEECARLRDAGAIDHIPRIQVWVEDDHTIGVHIGDD